MAISESAISPSHYISHHLQNWANKKQSSIVDFSVIHSDTVLWSIFVGLLMLVILYIAAKRSTANVPSRFQCFVEMLVEMVDEQAKMIVKGNRKFIAPFALTIFVWISMMNFLDLVPVDLAAKLFDVFGLSSFVPYHRIVPTADLNCPLGIALGVLIVCLFYSLKIKGFIYFGKELFTVPFGSFPLLWAPNLLFNLIEYFAKTTSLAVRLFGNMYAGELLFLLIALLGSIWNFAPDLYFLGFLGQVIAGSAWAIFHILVIFLQAFIFMMLALVYIGQAHEKH